ncbi:MAG: oxygen-independent coproporphyrinogen III oxidase-like protein, partial [Betaproteobacteria bacterium]|nr:oxygen-independent coproporphyrinogen III oxidase-like protein [Betaproteobacteria bacterium]
DLASALHYVDEGLSHLSLYQFTLEPNTVFAKHAPACMPDEGLLESMQSLIESNLAHAGFEQYEVSAWAQTGQRCRHNLNYWQFGDYLGIGAGAHGKISDHQGIRRTVRRRSPELYMDCLKPESGKQHSTERWLAASDLPFEFMLNVLRLKDGVPSHWWQERTGLPANVLVQMANQAVSKGLLDQNPTRWRASDLGWRFLNDLQASFFG